MQHLDLSDNHICANGAESLGPHLALLTSLQYLDLSSNQIEAHGFSSGWGLTSPPAIPSSSLTLAATKCMTGVSNRWGPTLHTSRPSSSWT